MKIEATAAIKRIECLIRSAIASFGEADRKQQWEEKKWADFADSTAIDKLKEAHSLIKKLCSEAEQQ